MQFHAASEETCLFHLLVLIPERDAKVQTQTKNSKILGFIQAYLGELGQFHFCLLN